MAIPSIKVIISEKGGTELAYNEEYSLEADGVPFAPGASGLASTEVGPALRETAVVAKAAVTFPDILKAKSGKVSGINFSGNPKVYAVLFATDFPDTNYSVTIASSTDSRSWLADNIAANGFTLNSQASRTITGMVMWTAEHNGEST